MRRMKRTLVVGTTIIALVQSQVYVWPLDGVVRDSLLNGPDL